MMKTACFFGDSFVQGKGDRTGLGWVGRLGLGMKCHNFGVPGDTGRDVAARWRAQAAPCRPDLLFFCFGTNDCARGMVGGAVATARTILAEAQGWRPTLMMGPPPVGDCLATDCVIAALSRDLAILCRDLEIPYLPVFDVLAADPVWRGEAAVDDGSHPDAGGYAVLAGLVAEWPAWQAAIR